MNDVPVIHANIGDGKRRRFFLGADELQIIKREAGRGYYSIFSNFHEGAEPNEVQAIIRLALIGGGLSPVEADEIASYYCTPPRPMKDVYLLAYDILAAVWNGNKPSGKGERLTVEQMDAFFDDLEADLVKKGYSADLIRGKSFAEVNELLIRLSKDADKPEAPDAETFNAIKNSAKKATRK